MSNNERIQMLREMANEIKKDEAALKMKAGKFNDALAQFLRDNKVQENFSILDIVETFSPRIVL